MDLDLGIITEAEKRQKKKLLLDYLYANLKNHNFWAYRYFFCEFLALLNVLGEYIVFILYISLILILYGYISYAIKKVRNSQLLIFEKNGLVWPADIWPAHFFKY